MAESLSIQELHPLEIIVLRSLILAKPFTARAIAEHHSLSLGQANQALSWLNAKALITAHQSHTERYYERTPLGEEWNTVGSPMQRFFRALERTSIDTSTDKEVSNSSSSSSSNSSSNSSGNILDNSAHSSTHNLDVCTREGLSIQELAQQEGISQQEVGSAFGFFKTRNIVELDSNKKIRLCTSVYPDDLIILSELLSYKDALSEKSLTDEQRNVLSEFSKKRGSSTSPFRIVEEEIVSYTLSEQGKAVIEQIHSQGLTGEEKSKLTSKMLKDGTWHHVQFRAYNVSLPPSRTAVGRRNAYSDFLVQVKDKLTSLGFEEYDGSLVQAEFWNADALFMPQFHSAREIHDVYRIAHPTHDTTVSDADIQAVADMHEKGGNIASRGWRYSFDKDFTRRLVLRSQGTCLSARQLKALKVPGRYFGITRVFRPDQVDATHLSDFYQTEGIAAGDDVNFCTLLGLLKLFAEEFAHAKEVRYVPGYFPFTEPSVEVHIRHPVLGWIELGGSGIFRPEVTRPFGIEVPVAAWGMGIDRMATLQMGISDLRDLFSYDLEKVARRRHIRV